MTARSSSPSKQVGRGAYVAALNSRPTTRLRSVAQALSSAFVKLAAGATASSKNSRLEHPQLCQHSSSVRRNLKLARLKSRGRGSSERAEIILRQATRRTCREHSAGSGWRLERSFLAALGESDGSSCDWLAGGCQTSLHVTPIRATFMTSLRAVIEPSGRPRERRID